MKDPIERRDTVLTERGCCADLGVVRLPVVKRV